MSNETSRTAESSASCSCSVTVLSFRSRSASSSRPYASVRRAESRAGASGESGDASKVGRCKRSRHRIMSRSGSGGRLDVKSTTVLEAYAPHAPSRTIASASAVHRASPPGPSTCRSLRGREGSAGGRGRDRRVPRRHPRDRGRKGRVSRRTTRRRNRCSRSERASACRRGACRPAVSGTAGTGRSGARTEECARAGVVPPDGKRSHILRNRARATFRGNRSSIVRRDHHRRLRATAPHFYHKNDVSLPVVPKPRRLCACSIPSNAMCSSPDPPAP